MSVAATTTNALTLIDPSSFKTNAAPAPLKSLPVAAPATAAVWSADNALVYVASAHAIHALSPVSAQLSLLFAPAVKTPLSPILAARDPSTLVFSQGNSIHLLSVSSPSPHITASLPPHAAPVAHLALSADGSLLASASTAGVLHVYNLVHNANSVLRAFPPAARAPCVCSFDPHLRTRLFVSAGTTLAVYDTARPAGAPKTISLTEKGVTAGAGHVGHVVAICSSPYSKTLVAVACSAMVALLDLDKEKPVFRTVAVKAPATAMAFTADGTAIVIGTETGKVLVQNLRAIDAAPRTFDVGKGERVVGLCIQKRGKHASPPLAVPVPRIPASHSASLSKQNLKSPSRRAIPAKSPATVTSRRADAPPPPKRAFSPRRSHGNEDPGNISVQLDTLIRPRGTRAPSRQTPAGPSSPLPPATTSPSPLPPSLASRDAAPTPTPAPTSLNPPSTASTRPSSAPSDKALSPPHPQAPSLPPPTNDPSPVHTASPDLPSVDADTPPSPYVLNPRAPPLVPSTPDMDRWIDAGRAVKVKDRRVAWADGDESDKENAPDDDDDPTVAVRAKTEHSSPPPTPSLDISPIHRPHLPPAAALQVSPLRANAASGNSGPQELLRAVVRDVMYEYRQETREDIKGLHLDLLRMGRSWKSELRAVMQEYVGDLRDLREENARLRAENDRLRRGY